MRHLAVAAALLTLVSCDSNDELIERPELCVFTVDSGKDPANAACPDKPQTFTPGQAFYIRHTVPAQAEVEAPVSITVETACPDSAVTTEHTHNDGVALIAALAPPGAQCSLVVTAHILNETTRYVSAPTSADCKAECPSPGAGGEDGGS